jgi:putative Mg2+ transporter-C (MgtC) family protein
VFSPDQKPGFSSFVRPHPSRHVKGKKETDVPTHLEWSDIALRLFLTVLAGTLIGVNRGEHGRPAGLRTTLLVGLAACVSMIQVNLLLPIKGKAADSFVVMDLMRLPLGILSGMGFIGASAILRKDDLIVGVTTAATLWFVTVLGLCFGGGQLALGLVALALGFVVLGQAKPIEHLWKQDRQANLTIVVGNNGPTENDITKMVVSAGFRIASLSVVYEPVASHREMNCLVKWRSRWSEIEPPAFVAELANRPDTLKVAWHE